MSNLVTLFDFQHESDAVASSADTGVEKGREGPESAKPFENWNAIVAGFEQMRDAPDVLMPTTHPDEH